MLTCGANGSTTQEVFDAINANSLKSNKNKIINGGFDIWQRGTSFTATASNVYTADRWKVNNVGLTVDKVSNGVLDNSLRFTNGTSSGSWDNIEQKIELPQSLVGKSLKVSFKIKWHTYNAEAYVWHGWVDGSHPFGGSIGVGTGDWEEYSIDVEPPSDATDYSYYIMRIHGRQAGGAAFDFEIKEIQFEEGSVVTPFEQRPIGLELSLCQRYYQKYTGALYLRFAFGFIDGANDFQGKLDIPTEMRVTPTLTSSGAFIIESSGGGEVPSAISLSFATQNSISISANGATSIVNSSALLRANNDTGAYIALDSEL